MRGPTRLGIAAAALVTAAAAVAWAALPASAADNLVTNPGFESGLAGWSCQNGSTVTSPVHSGSSALAGAADNVSNAQCTQTVAVQPSSAYTLSAWVRGNYVFIGATNFSSNWTPSAADWTLLSTSFTTGAGVTSVQIFLHGWYAQGTYFADDVVLAGPGGSVPVPPTPTGLAVTGTTTSSVSLSWNSSAGATSYTVRRNGANPVTVTGTSTTVTGLASNTTYSFTVSAVSTAGESAQSAPVSATTPSCPAGSSRSWPYIDVTMPTPTMASVAGATGHRFFTTAFVIGSSAGCVPSWGGTIPLTESRIVNDINAIKGMGGDVTVAFGGAVGPYLEHVCGSQAQLVAAYERVIDTLHITHIDVDIEASINIDMMNKALAQVQRERPGTSLRFTLMVQSDDFGLNPALGTDVLTNAKANGVNVEIVNPMIGRNFNGRIFQLEDGSQLVAWANANHIGLLAFWSVGRDNGGCPGGGVSPTCSSIAQSTYQFTNIFKGFTG